VFQVGWHPRYIEAFSYSCIWFGLDGNWQAK
jgi:hypothetical protein